MSAMSMIALKRVVISVFISIDLNIIHIQSRVFTGLNDRDKNRGSADVFNRAFLNEVNTRARFVLYIMQPRTHVYIYSHIRNMFILSFLINNIRVERFLQ